MSNFPGDLGFERSHQSGNVYSLKTEVHNDRFAFADEKKTSKTKEQEKLNRIGLEAFRQVSAAETGAAPARDSKIVATKSQVKDTIFSIFGEAAGLTEKEVLATFKQYIRENPEEVKRLTKQIAKVVDYNFGKKMTSKLFLELLSSPKSYDLLSKKISKEDQPFMAEAFAFVNYIRCNIGAKLFHLDIDLHDIVVTTDPVFGGVALERNHVRAFDPSVKAMEGRKITIVCGTKSHMGMGRALKPPQFIQPVRFETPPSAPLNETT